MKTILSKLLLLAIFVIYLTNLSAQTQEKCGIGETDPDSKLEIKGLGNDNTTSSLNVKNSDDTSCLYVNDDCEVGIGTKSPQAKLEVVNNGAIHTILRNTNSTNYTSLRLYNNLNSNARSLEIDYSGSGYSGALVTGGPTGESGLITTSGAYPLVLGTSNNARLTILSSGSIGIGTSVPVTTLNLNNTNESTTQTNFTQSLTNSGLLISTEYTSNAFTPGLFWNTTDNNATKPKAGIYLKETGSGTYMYFGTSNNYATGITNDALAIDYSGNVGVGTPSPGYTLDVNGDMRVQGNDIFGSGSLILNGAGGGYVETKSNSSTYGLIVREYNSSDYGNIEVTSDGLGLGYNTGGAHLTINSSGNIGIKTTSPQDYLHVYTTASGAGIQVGDNAGLHTELEHNDLKFNRAGKSYISQMGNGQLAFTTNGGSNIRMLIDESGNIGINKESPSVTLDVNGSVNCTGGSCSSDRRYKKNIRVLENPLEKVMALQGVNYEWKMDKFPQMNFRDGIQVGFIAQEVEKIIPELVLTMDDGYKAMDYEKLTAYLVEAIKNQQERIALQQNQIDDLYNELRAMKSIYNNLINANSPATVTK